MAQWEHKEAVWHSPISNRYDYQKNIYQIMLIDGVLVEEGGLSVMVKVNQCKIFGKSSIISSMARLSVFGRLGSFQD